MTANQQIQQPCRSLAALASSITIKRDVPLHAHIAAPSGLGLFEGQLMDQQSAMGSATMPNDMVKLAPYKLAFVISKHKMPFTSCDEFMEFSRSVDPASTVLNRMPCSGVTISKRTFTKRF